MIRRTLAFLLFAAPALTLAQGDAATVAKIIDEGKNRSQVMKHLWHFTKNIGPRLTGSPRYEKAAHWAATRFRQFGLMNSHLDKWGDVPVGFDRGPGQSARMLLPYERKFQFTTQAWTAGTKGPVRGKAIAEPTTMEEFNRVKDKLKGAWVIAPNPVTMRGPQPIEIPADVKDPEATKRFQEELKKVQDAVASSGILGRVFGSTSELVHTHGSFRDLTWENLPKDIRITIRKSDMDAIKQVFTAGREVTIEIEAQNIFIKGPMPQYNVVAEIPGTEKPDEVVIFSGHLDSWNGPGSEGASDNGTGSSVMMEAARILAKVGAKPKRTIRFILWGGEEQGLLGSGSYAKRHEGEMNKISAVFVDDGGSNYQGGVSATADMVAILEKALAPMTAAFPDMPVKVSTVPAIRGGGSDHGSFIPYGVPGFFFHETGKQNYGSVWHTQNDTYENAIPEYLVQSATNTAVLAYNLACADTLLPRVPKSAGAPQEIKPWSILPIDID